MSDPRPSTSVSSSRSGIGCFGLSLFACLIFGILKVAGVLEITWLTVFAPALIVAGLTGIAFLVILAIILAFTGRRKR